MGDLANKVAQEWNISDQMTRSIVKSVLDAIAEPTAAMISEGWLAAHRVQTDDRCNHEMLRRAWTAMIDEALK